MADLRRTQQRRRAR